MRPNCSNVIANRIISTLPFGLGTYAPARKEFVTHQMAHTCLRLLFIDNSTPEQMPNIGGERIHLASIAIEGQCKKLPLLVPEILVKALLEFCRFVLQPLRKFWISPECPCEAGTANLRVIDI